MKSTTKTDNTPWAPSQPYILKNLQQQDDVFNSSQPQLSAFAADQRGTYGRLAPGAEQGIMGAQGVVNANLSGANLHGNPYLDGIIGSTNRDITDQVNSQFMPRFGSGYHAKVLAQQLAENENKLRYGNYAQERGYQQDAIGDAQNMMGGAQGLLNNAAELPWIGVQAANGAVRQASGGYGTQTTTQKQGIGGLLAGVAGAGLSGWAGGGFK